MWLAPASAAGPHTASLLTSTECAAFLPSLMTGATCVGALDIYQDRPTAMSEAALSDAGTFADIAIHLLAKGQVHATVGDLDTDVEQALAPRKVVYQAQGMIMADLDVSSEEALALLRAHAFTLGRPVQVVARDVIAGVLRLTL